MLYYTHSTWHNNLKIKEVNKHSIFSEVVCVEKSFRPETTIHRKSCLQDWPSAGIWEHGFQECPYYFLTDNYYAETVYKQYDQHMLGREYLQDQLPVDPGHLSLMVFPGQKHQTHVLLYFCCRGIVNFDPYGKQGA